MTRQQILTRLERAYKSSRLNHKPSAIIAEKLKDTRTRDLIAGNREAKRHQRLCAQQGVGA